MGAWPLGAGWPKTEAMNRMTAWTPRGSEVCMLVEQSPRRLWLHSFIGDEPSLDLLQRHP